MFVARVGFVLLVAAAGGVAQNNTAPLFGPPTYYQRPTDGGGPFDYVTTADINGDGYPDLVVVKSGSRTLSVFFNDGTGKFGSRIDSDLGGQYGYNAAIGDFNSDGHLDIAVVMANFAVQLMLGDGKGSFTLRSTLATGAPSNYCGGPIISTDLNRDGRTDLIVNNCNSNAGNAVSVFLGKGDGTFASPLFIAPNPNGATDYQQDMVVADFNNDGLPDVVVRSSTGIALLIGNGDGTFKIPIVLPTSPGYPMRIVTADFNGDGNADLAILPYDPRVGSSPLFRDGGNSVVLYLGDGKGNFRSLAAFPIVVSNDPTNGGLAYHMEMADLNGDGILDLALTFVQTVTSNGGSNDLLVFLGKGDGTFTSAIEYPNTSGSNVHSNVPVSAFAAVDVNGDRKPDLLFYDNGSQIGAEFNITASRLMIAITTLPAGVINKPYSQTLVASGGTSPYTWSLTSGSLPSGLNLSGAGVISGTPTAIGTSTFSVKVTDSVSATVTLTLTLAITNGILTITTSSPLVPAAVGFAYSQTLGASGGVTPYTWTVASGSLPSGLTLSPAGVVSGTPGTAGSYGFIAKVTDSSAASTTQAYTLTVIAVGSLTRSGALSHIAAGGGWTTVITLVNTTAAPVAVIVGLHNDNGTPLSLAVTTTQQGVTQTVTTSSVSTVISPNATFLISTGDQVPSLSVGWADVSSSGPVNGFAIFRTVSSNSPVSEGTVPLQTQFPSTITLPYDNTAGFVMGVALANLSTSSANVTATIWDDSGNLLGTQIITIAGNGHTSFVLPNQISLTAGRRGIVQFQSSGGLAGLGLRFSPFGTFTSIPTM